MTSTHAIGLDIGGTKIAAALVAPTGIVGDVHVVATNAAQGAPAVLDRAVGLGRTVRNTPGSRASAIGLATGGWMDRTSGRVVAATGLLPGWAGLDLRTTLADAFALPVVALNDAHAMGIAEARLGAGRGARVCLSVAIGTGIGGAITIDGRLSEGAHGLAGALGHIQAQARGRICSCGRRGCVEAVASGPAIARAFAQCRRRLDGSNLKDRPDLTDVVEALRSGGEVHACARRTVADAGAVLGRVLAGVANTVDPDLVVLGGGAAVALGEPFLAAIRDAFDRGVLWTNGVDVVPAGLGPHAAVVGAGLLAIDMVSPAKSLGASVM